jgi:hypothetical protein
VKVTFSRTIDPASVSAGRLAEARELIQQAESVAEKARGAQDPGEAQAREMLADSLAAAAP